MSLVEKIEDESWPKEITDEDLSAGKIANLPNHPNRGAVFGATGLTAPQLKAYFDKNVELLKGIVNAIIKYGDPAALAGKIEIGSINGWDDIATLYDFIVEMEEGGLSDKFFVKFEDEEQRYVLNEFLQSLQKNKVQSKQGGTDKGKVYIINENSDDALLGYDVDATPHSIVKRTESGDVLLPEGSSDERAAISRKDAAALLSEAVTKDVFQEEQNRTNTFVKSAKVEYDEANHVIRLTFTDGNGETDTSSVDLPLEMAFVGARLEDGNLVFTLQNGQEVSVPIGDVLGGLITSGALAQSLSGNEEDKAPSVRAVNEGLAGKLDATLPSEVTSEYAYMISPYGNEIRRMSGVENTQGNIPSYRRVAETDRDDKGATINVTMPKYGNNAANKRYVDNKCRDLQQGVYNALGVQYITVEDTSDSLPPSVPANAMRFACIESVGNAVACAEDGTEIGSVDVQVLANYMPVDTATLPVYVDMGDRLLLDYELSNGAPAGTFFVKVTGRKIIYQTKVGA